MGRHPVFTITLVMIGQTIFCFWRGGLWYTDEVRHASVLQNLLRSGHWLLLQMNGEPYVDKPPLYFWFVALLVKLFGTDRPPVFFVAAALSGWFFLQIGRASCRERV